MIEFNKIPNLIWNIDLVNDFIRIIPELDEQKAEVYFLSLSARKKLLTDAERLHYDLGRTEMFSRIIIKKKSNYFYGLKKCLASLAYRNTKSGLPFPEKCLVMYANINPSSMVKAYGTFTQEMQQASNDAIAAAISGAKIPNLSAFHSMESRMMAAIQSSKGNKGLLDIDFDVDESQSYMVDEFSEVLRKANIRYAIIQTQGGFHVMINRSDLNRNTRLDRYVREYHNIVKDSGGEVVFNQNAMVPIPGTLQGGFKVNLLYSDLPTTEKPDEPDAAN